MSVCHETNHKVFSRNTCRKIGSNAFEKKKRSCPFFHLQRQGGRSQKKLLSSDWAENFADSNKGLILRPEAIAEGVYEQTSTECDPSVSTSTFSARRSTENYGWRTSWRSGRPATIAGERLQEKINKSVTWRRFCQGSVELVENLRTWFHLDVSLPERKLSV